MNISRTKVVATLLAVITLTAPAFAGDREWAVAGKVLTGVAAVSVIDRIVNPPQPVVVYQQPVVVSQPVVATAPVVVARPPTVVYVEPSPVIYYRPQPVFFYPHYHYYHRGWR